ncbi:phage terminase large subunit [Novosphingobium meiothermophilum]|uniref:phage terminase large subunit n=1 Tax=Novosphingobium meiothermophilum TaxID=2202251 RepID=UPI000D6DF2EF|nr:phage terminase large subunit [Novosphingobium meiothermophilum]
MTPEERLKASFLVFLAYVWVRVLRLPKPTRIQKDIAEFLANGHRRRFIAAFRGVGKTFLTAAYIVWRLWRDPDLKIMVVSANERFSHKIAAFIHTLIGSEDVISMEPVPWAELQARPGQRNSTLEFEVGPAGPSKDPSVAAFGITGQITGGRADVLLFDDVEVPKNSETEALREKLRDRMGEAEAILKPGGEIIVLGTFQSMASIYRGLGEKGFEMRVWPARYPTKEKLPLYANLAPLLRADLEANPDLGRPVASTLGGAPTDPDRFHDADLVEREAGWGRAGFQLQFMLDTSLVDADKFPLKTSDLIVMDVPEDLAPARVVWGSGPELVIKELDNVGFDGDRMHRPMFRSPDFEKFTGSLLSIDPSGRGADETAYVVTKFLNGSVFVRRWGGYRDGHSEATLSMLARHAFEEKVAAIQIEANFGDGMFSRLLEPHLRRIYQENGKAPPPIIDHKVSGQKELRIMAVVRPALQQHRLVFDTAMVRKDLLEARSGAAEGAPSTMETSGLYQLTHLTEARGALRKDDRIDVLAHALTYWAEYMNADALEAEKRREAEAAKRFEQELFGSAILKTGRSAPRRAAGRRR